MAKKTVWVHAWEYVNPGPSAGGGGFDWYENRENALAAYNRDWRSPSMAHFFFPYEIEEADAPDADAITQAIDGELHEACAHAAERRVGDQVLAYWNKRGMKMENA